MTNVTKGSLVDLLKLSTLSPKKPPPRKRPQNKARHRWTDEELNLVSYLRLHRNWTWSQIHRTFFSSLSYGAITVILSRVSTEEQAHRAAAASTVIIDPTRTIGQWMNNSNQAPTLTLTSSRTSFVGLRLRRFDVSSQLSDASSTDLFGLETRSVSPSNSPCDEFFSAEESPRPL